MEVVLTQLRDFSCKSPTFDEPAGQSACRGPPRRAERLGEAAEGGRKLDIESALAWLRKELVGSVHKLLFYSHTIRLIVLEHILQDGCRHVRPDAAVEWTDRDVQ